MFQSQSHATCGPCELETDSPPTSEWPWSWWSIYHDHVDTILIVDGFNQYKPLPDHSNAPMLPWLHLHKQNNTCIVFQHNIHDIYLKPLSYWLVDVCLCLVWCQTAWIISYDVSLIMDHILWCIFDYIYIRIWFQMNNWYIPNFDKSLSGKWNLVDQYVMNILY